MIGRPRLTLGFTLTELMVSIAIAAIITALATPSLREFIQNNRAVTQINELHAALSFARSEAVKSNNNVSLCKSDNGTSCNVDSDHFHDGYIVFIDSDSDGSVDISDRVLRVQNAISGDTELRFDKNYVTYRSDGLIKKGFGGTFALCDDRGTAKAKGLIIGPSGHARLAIDSNENGIPEEYDGTDLGCSS